MTEWLVVFRPCGHIYIQAQTKEEVAQLLLLGGLRHKEIYSIDDATRGKGDSKHD